MVKFIAQPVGYSLPPVRKQRVKRKHFTGYRENDHAGCQSQEVYSMDISWMGHSYCKAIVVTSDGGAA